MYNVCIVGGYISAPYKYTSSKNIAIRHESELYQRCADCGRVRLRTQIRSNFWIRGLTADGFFRGRCGRGLTRITISQREFYGHH